jgi:hypothetical protein
MHERGADNRSKLAYCDPLGVEGVAAASFFGGISSTGTKFKKSIQKNRGYPKILLKFGTENLKFCCCIRGDPRAPREVIHALRGGDPRAVRKVIHSPSSPPPFTQFKGGDPLPFFSPSRPKTVALKQTFKQTNFEFSKKPLKTGEKLGVTGW